MLICLFYLSHVIGVKRGICTPASPTSNITDAKAIVFRYCVAAISIGNLLITIIISVFLRLIKAHRGRVYLLLGEANDNERAWRVQEISILFSVPPSSLIWSIILIMPGMIFFPSDGEVYPGHHSAHSHRDGRHGRESRSVVPFPLDSPAHTGVQQPLLSPVTLIMIAIVAALTLLHFVFILRLVVRLANIEPDTDSSKPSKMMQADVDALAQENSSGGDCSASGVSGCVSECSSGNSSESDSAAGIELSARIIRRRRQRPSAAHRLDTQDSTGI
ncbi:hypothetical protein BC629DRAFT_1589300 [Irpex lacteus]|nr:hypothetical protein BC629DRAFT_1589300 [Irpex lacteus]